MIGACPGILETLRGSRCIGDGPDQVAMLWTYLDDSSDDKRERFCAAGGFFTMDTRCQKLEIDWRARTSELTEPFRSTDCEGGFGQFKGWEKPKRDSLMADLCELIKKHDLGAFGACVSVRDYKTVFPDARLHDPYLLCLGMCFANIAQIHHTSNGMVRKLGLPPSTVHFWIELNKDTIAREGQIYADVQSLDWAPAKRMSSIAHPPKGPIGLQAADLMAREVFKYYDNQGVRPVRKPVLSLADNVTFFSFSEDNLRDFAGIWESSSYALALAVFAERIAKAQATPITGVTK